MENFESNLNEFRVNIYWGVDSIDKTNISLFEINKLGRVIFDDSFSLEKTEVQDDLVNFC